MDLLPAQVWTRVMRFKGESGRTGAAFVCTVGGREVLVTARHLCGDDEEENVQLVHRWTNSGHPRELMLTRLDPRDSLIDAAVFDLPAGALRGVMGDVEASSDGLHYTQDTFILGYPFGLSLHLGGGPLDQMALAKRGILSGSTDGESGENIFIVDTIANPGFSGGPMVFKPVEPEAEWRIGGIVRGSITAPASEPTPQNPHPPSMTAGLSYVVDVGAVTRWLE